MGHFTLLAFPPPSPPPPPSSFLASVVLLNNSVNVCVCVCGGGGWQIWTSHYDVARDWIGRFGILKTFGGGSGKKWSKITIPDRYWMVLKECERLRVRDIFRYKHNDHKRMNAKAVFSLSWILVLAGVHGTCWSASVGLLEITSSPPSPPSSTTITFSIATATLTTQFAKRDKTMKLKLVLWTLYSYSSRRRRVKILALRLFFLLFLFFPCVLGLFTCHMHRWQSG